ncbi:AAA domain-containing protein [Lactarius quietus]|nr:AAA domain-containing protein [Lactarius quietus]
MYTQYDIFFEVTRLHSYRPIVNVVVDEASQIEVSQYVPLFKSFGNTLRKLCFIGDDKQLPPHGQDDLKNLQSIFEVNHLKTSAVFLDTQYRMPPQIGDFISKQVYKGELKSNPEHRTKSSTVACRFVDISGAEQLDADGKSIMNPQEVEAVTLIAEHLQEADISYRIITPYDAQRSAIEQALKDRDLDWHDKCFNVDSFQGNEDHVIVISVVRSKAIGFLSSLRRTNVMLTRCQRRMYIVSSRAFLEGKGASSLVGKMAAELGKRPGAWLSRKDIEDWDPEYSKVES